jgi:hypothetical protein
VRRLTVKNFSVIKEAELEFGKITVLIGPQSSGKSLLCKLAYFFQQIVVEQADATVRGPNNVISNRVESQINTLEARLVQEFFSWFGIGPIQPGISEISYLDGSFGVKITHERLNTLPLVNQKCELSGSIHACYESVWKDLVSESTRPNGHVDLKHYAQELRTGLDALRSPETPDIYTYAPSTRAFFVTTQKAVIAAANRVDEISARFARDFNYGFENSIPKQELNHPLTTWINSVSERILQGKLIALGSDFQFQAIDGRVLPLSILSSGTQELLPLITCLREYVAATVAVATLSTALGISYPLHKRLFFIEEPEAGVFPSTQYELVRVFARMAGEPALDASWVITTHSPYVLSSFNNFIYAGQLGKDKAIRRKIPIEKKYWIEPGAFAAYSIHDGICESILSKSGLIDGEYLDSVSEKISNEFDSLLRLEYDKTKAS